MLLNGIKCGWAVINLNKDVTNTFLNQLWRLIAGPIILILIPIYLTAEQQGYWFGFSSLAALAIFADLGFSNIVLQFAAHEFAYLSFDKNGHFTGDTAHFQKLSSLLVFSIKWAGAVAAIAFPIIFAIGFFVLSKSDTAVSWIIPWVLYGASSALVFLNSTILCFFEGCDSVRIVQGVRFRLAFVGSIVIMISLFLKLHLYALAFSMLANSLVGIYLIYTNFGAAIRELINASQRDYYSWRGEFLRLAWKYAVSWASGYFIFQMYTPLSFQFHGAVEAGKVGLSISLWMAVFGLSNIWIQANTPKFNMCIAKKDWVSLDRIFMKNLLLAVLTFLLGVLIVFIALHLVGNKTGLRERMVDTVSMALLGFAWLMQVVANSLAVYLRAHKEEPLVMLSVVGAAYTAVSTFLCAKYLSADYLFLGFVSNCFFGVPWMLYIFHNKRKTHGEFE